MRLFAHRKKCRHLAAFSLVELVVSIGIFAVAITSVVGLFPLGLTVLRSSMNDTTEGQMVQYIASTASLSAYTNVAQPATVYFDQDGRYLTNAADANIRYKVLTRPVAASLPGTATFSTNDMLCLQISVIHQAGPNGAAMGSNAYTIQVANQGK